MTSEGKPTISIKLLIDQERNNVILAEAGGDFVDTLFSFLFFPLGTITRLFVKQQSLQPAVIGCLNNLYNSVENLSLERFRTAECKRMLLYPRYINEDKCQKLKFNIDDTKPSKYFICPNMNCSRNIAGGMLSYYENSRCTCGKLMNREIYMKEKKVVQLNDITGGVFYEGESIFFITDDLRVMQGLPGGLIEYLRSLGLNNVNLLAEEVLQIGLEEMSNLLTHSLISKTTLTDVFLRKQRILSNTPTLDKQFAFIPTHKKESTSNDSKTSVKIMLRKSDRKILYAEAGEDFIDLIFSFLTIPIESVLKLLGGIISVGCISNLFRDLNTKWSITKEESSQKAVLPPYYSCLNKFPDILSREPPAYYCFSELLRSSSTFSIFLTSKKISVPSGQTPVPLTLMDPKSPSPVTTNSSGYVKKMSKFLVTDDLVVKSLPSISSISLLKELETPLDDFEEHVISIGEVEVSHLLNLIN
ncbi:hypothetical protein CRYUN_Cryun05aG0265600 [Craigia yunnanensis]